MEFDDVFARLYGHEGDLSEDEHDPGGVTKYGISQRAYPDLDIRNLTIDQAKAIYLRDYWYPLAAHRLPASIRFDLFDMGVNSGLHQAKLTLQHALGVVPDGVIGPKTLAAAQAMDPERLVARFAGWRLDFLNDLPKWPRYARGWTQRIAENLKST